VGSHCHLGHAVEALEQEVLGFRWQMLRQRRRLLGGGNVVHGRHLWVHEAAQVCRRGIALWTGVDITRCMAAICGCARQRVLTTCFVCEHYHFCYVLNAWARPQPTAQEKMTRNMGSEFKHRCGSAWDQTWMPAVQSWIHWQHWPSIHILSRSMHHSRLKSEHPSTHI